MRESFRDKRRERCSHDDRDCRHCSTSRSRARSRSRSRSRSQSPRRSRACNESHRRDRTEQDTAQNRRSASGSCSPPDRHCPAAGRAAAKSQAECQSGASRPSDPQEPREFGLIIKKKEDAEDFAGNEEARARAEDRMKLLHGGDEALGRHAKTVYRDKKSGKKIDVALERLQREQEERRKLVEQEKQMEWGKGLVQRKEQEERQRVLEEARSGPFAVYSTDERYNKHMRERERWGDPMLDHVTKAKSEAKPSRPVYRGPAPAPNRFNIAPGYRWDGVDRSSGFEKKHFERQGAKASLKQAAYQWSVEDM